MAKNDDFKRYWRQTFTDAFTAHLGSAATLPAVNSTLSNEQWIQEAFSMVWTDTDLYELLTACSCRYPEDELEFFRTLYRKTRNIYLVHQAIQEWFLTMIIPKKQLNHKQIELMISKGMGMAGTLKGFTITAVKIPKEFNEWREETDPTAQKRLYCHCRHIRDSFLTEKHKEIPKGYCTCGAGFYKHLWEFILEEPVEVASTESLLTGADFCKILINLPGKPHQSY